MLSSFDVCPLYTLPFHTRTQAHRSSLRSAFALGGMYLHQLPIALSLVLSWAIQVVSAGNYVYCYQPCMIAACGDAFFSDCTCGYNTKFDIMNCTARTCWDATQASRDSLSFLRQCSRIPLQSLSLIPFSPIVRPPSTYSFRLYSTAIVHLLWDSRLDDSVDA